MKDILKKIDTFMLKYGGYTLLIALVAIGSSLAVLQWANDYLKEKTKELEIKVAADGTLSVDYNYDDKENVYILWETDGGSVTTQTSDKEFEEQEENKKYTNGYYSYGHSADCAKWQPEDADGNTYKTATVRAVLYEKNEKSSYNLENYILEITVTLEYGVDGNVKKADDRFFGNPVRSNSDEDWSQIYCIEETEDMYTYRYRTGHEIDKEDVLILCWKSADEILSETDYANGLCPNNTILENNSNKTELKAVTTVSCKKNLFDKAGNIQAGLITEDTYKKTEILEKDILYPASISP